MKKWENSFFYEARGERSFFEIAEEFGIGEMILRAANPGVRQIRAGNRAGNSGGGLSKRRFSCAKRGRGDL